MNAGTIALNAEAGRTNSRIAPAIPPLTDAADSLSSRARCPRSSSR